MIRVLSFFILTVALCSCMQTNNSSALDADVYGGTSNAVSSIFSQNCGGTCHSFAAMSVDQLVAAGLIVKGDPLNSKIYYRLAGSAGTNGPKTMPQGGSLSSTDISTIQSWISGL